LIANQKKCKRDLSESQTALQTIADCAKALGCKNIKLPGVNNNSPLLTKKLVLYFLFADTDLFSVANVPNRTIHHQQQ
jgi:hypothetical protein